MKPDMKWLIGHCLSDVEKLDYSWFFRLDNASNVATESPWRLLTSEGISVTSEDHGHKFGLPAPVDAAERVKRSVGDNHVVRYELRERTGDLTLYFANDVAVEFLNLSCGYEAWRSMHGTQTVFCGSGGQLTEFRGTGK